MARQSTSTKLRVNAKVESFNTIMLPQSASETVTEGLFVNGDGTLADTTSAVAFLAWNDDSRSDVTNSITDPASGDSLTIETGGMAGIVGNGVVVGLPEADVTNGASAAAGMMVTSDANGKPVAAAYSARAGAGVPDTFVFGVVVKREGGIVWFVFNSHAHAFDATA